MDYVKSTDQLMEEIIVSPNEIRRYYVFENVDLFMITGFVAYDGKYFETFFKYDEETLSNEERYEVLQQKELIDELHDGATQSIGYDLKMKEEK